MNLPTAGNYIGIYDGKNGQHLARMPLDGGGGLAISPDGAVVAIGKILPDKDKLVLLVETYEVSSGRRIASYLHDTIPPGKYQHLVGTLDTLQFTSDGSYLITSGNNCVKAWHV
jgi:hypothetical protein